MPDKLEKYYYWHIITLVLMKNKRNEIRKRVKLNTDQSIKN